MANEEKNLENVNEEPTQKKGRHRKKQLYNSILQLMEFYFSDSNLTKDRFLSKIIQEDPFVDINIILKFNKMRKLTSNIEDVQKAVKKSNLIELSEDGTRIRRKEPLKEKPNVDECTIYVERLKPDATHDWLTSIFSEFGTVSYISIPRYKHNNVIKGFAFIEFDKEEEAEKTVKYFESIGCRMPSNTEPEELCSIKTFEAENATDENPKKRKFDEVESENEEGEKKAKLETDEMSESDADNKKKKKIKKEHKKKNYIKELGLQVLFKKEWKKMRNRYLDLQRKKMKEFKKHLMKAKYGQANYEEKIKKKEEEDVKASKYEMVEGIIVKMKLDEPVADVKKTKNELKTAITDVQYIDIPNVGCEEIYLRFGNKESAANYCTQEKTESRILLTGEEEKMYWEKINNNRQQKLKKSTKKQRGRDKLLKKAKHIKFDEN